MPRPLSVLDILGLAQQYNDTQGALPSYAIGDTIPWQDPAGSAPASGGGSAMPQFGPGGGSAPASGGNPMQGAGDALGNLFLAAQGGLASLFQPPSKAQVSNGSFGDWQNPTDSGTNPYGGYGMGAYGPSTVPDQNAAPQTLASMLASLQPGESRAVGNHLLSRDDKGAFFVDGVPANAAFGLDAKGNPLGGTGGGGGGAGPSLGYGGLLSFEQQMAMAQAGYDAQSNLAGQNSAANYQAQQLIGQQKLEQVNLENQSAAAVARINADSALSTEEKHVQIAQINADAMMKAHEIDGNLALLGHQVDAQSASDIEQMRADLGHFTADLSAQTENAKTAATLLTSVLGFQSNERQSRQAAAMSFFNALAGMAPQQNLVSAYYVLRGMTPPPTLAQTAMPQLANILGVSGDQQSAITNASGINNITAAPWLQDLMGVTATPKGG